MGEPSSAPSPAETDALAWAAIAESDDRKRCAGARGLCTFVRDVARALATPKGDDRTNIIDQGERATYALPRGALAQLFGALEACRLERTPTHFSERQDAAASGLMLDLDIVTAQRRPALTDRHYYRLAGLVTAALGRDVDFGAATEARIHVFFIVKPEAVPAPPRAESGAAAPAPMYRYGVHVLVPGVQLPRGYKRWLLQRLAADPALAGTLADLGAVGDSLDMNSASVPVLFFGSCKRGGTPYVLGAALEVTIEVAGASAWPAPPIIRRLADADLAGYNLVAELGLVVEAEYGNGRPPLVAKRPHACRPAVAAEWGAALCAPAPAPELLAEHSLSTLTLHDAEARHLHALLDLLGPEFSAERGRWRDVVFALANTSEQYRPLAAWFSQRCPEKWDEAAFDRLWADALARRGGAAPLTLRSIAHWAREADPARYSAAMERSYFMTITSYVYAYGGKLQHYMVAKVLHAMLASKFCVDVDAGPRGPAYCWFEFVLPGQAMRPGEVWKWRREVDPDDVHVYMSEKLTTVLNKVSEHIEEKRAGAPDEAAAKHYQLMGKTFASAKLNLFNDTFKAGVVRQANYLFRRRGFAEALDRAPDLFGTLNGVLQLGPRCRLIDHFHEHAISRFAPVAWRRLDPADFWTQTVLRWVEDIIVEPDARDWILFHAAQGLSGDPKEGLMLLWEGGGQNGKTSFLRGVAKALGPYADKFNIQLMCCDREDADRPNSAVMRFKHLNYAYSEESNRAQALNVARMKEMVNAGEISGRDLNSRQETFTMHTNMVAASQYSFIVNTTDHGTWRRLRHYTSKTKFRRDPDPANPFEKADDQRFIRQYPSDPRFQTAVLGLLTHYYERLQVEFNGELKNVRAPTIDGESEAFRVKQDALHRWICEAVVLAAPDDLDAPVYPMAALASLYTEWYTLNIDRTRHVSAEVIKELESSALGKMLRPTANHTLSMFGCRVLTPTDPGLRPGEQMIALPRHDAGVGGPAARGRADWWAARHAAEFSL